MSFLDQILIPTLLLILFTLFYVLKFAKYKAEKYKAINETELKYSEIIKTLETNQMLLNERLAIAQKQLEDKSEDLNLLRNNNEVLMDSKIKLTSENKYLNEKIEEQVKEFERLQNQAVLNFEVLANKILKKNSEDFSEFNQKKIGDLILPLKEKISGFEKKVEETYEKGLKDQTDLKAELKKLYELNNRISTEANNLTKALKGDVKQQGNWGEIVLERILDRSGLTEGQEYEREKVVQNAEGKTIRPDVIVNLPDKKHIIVDSKVSLLAYDRYVNSEVDDEREKHMKAHLLSLKTHIKELSAKHYNSSPQVNSPDFVLLFIPIESSFSVAIEYDQQLFNYAWDNKVVIVSPSTLLATLRTIASIWQQENQTKNALEIAKQGGLLYDKFVGFISDIERLGKNIDTLQKTYDDASKKLYTGSGNLVRKVENLKELGASATKAIPKAYKQ